MSEPRVPSDGLVALVDALAPYWGGEAEVVGAYFTSSARTPQSDRRWLARQCHKELVDGVETRLGLLNTGMAEGGETDRGRLQRWAHEAAEELDHFCLFADAHDGIGGGPPLTVADARETWTWPANDELRALRNRHQDEHGRVGWRALIVTEGGYGVLYAAGAALAGGGGADDLIAGACARVLADEFDHVLQAIAGSDAADDEDWSLLRELALTQCVARIRMRDEQFDHPVDATRLEDLLAGQGSPTAFEWERSGFVPPHQPSATASRKSATASR